jgi:hypothetical protein
LAIAAVDSYSLARASYSECRYLELMAVLESSAACFGLESSAGLDLPVSFLVSDLWEWFLGLVSDLWEWFLGLEHWDSFAELCCPDSAPLFLVLGRLSRVLGRLYPEQAWPFPEPDSCWAAMCLASAMVPELPFPLRQTVTAAARRSARYLKSSE